MITHDLSGLLKTWNNMAAVNEEDVDETTFRRTEDEVIDAIRSALRDVFDSVDGDRQRWTDLADEDPIFGSLCSVLAHYDAGGQGR